MIERVRKQRGYTCIDNGFLRDPDLPLAAVGLLTVIFSFPDNVPITANMIADQRPLDSYHAVKSSIKKLIEAGYCTRYRRKGSRGTFDGWVYTVYETKQDTSTEVRNTNIGEASTEVRFTDVGDPHLNISTSNTISSSNSLGSSKDISIDTSTLSKSVLDADISAEEAKKAGEYMEYIESTQQPPKEKSSAKKERAIVPIPESLSTPAFIEQWGLLITTKKWRNKEVTALEASLKKLSKFCADFAVELVVSAIAGSYQGVVFSDTDDKYQKWLKNRQPNHQAPYGKFERNEIKQDEFERGIRERAAKLDGSANT